MGGKDMTGPEDDLGGPLIGMAFAIIALVLMLVA
jgi:hypothetical protein